MDISLVKRSRAFLYTSCQQSRCRWEVEANLGQHRAYTSRKRRYTLLLTEIYLYLDGGRLPL